MYILPKLTVTCYRNNVVVTQGGGGFVALLGLTKYVKIVDPDNFELYMQKLILEAGGSSDLCLVINHILKTYICTGASTEWH